MEKDVFELEKNRNIYIDIVKSFAILLVVIGHCIQYGSGVEYLNSQEFFYNKLFTFIYSFHMPLFMLISGYLFYFSIKKVNSLGDPKIIIYKKVKQLLVPLLCWSIVFLGIELLKLMVLGNLGTVSLLWSIKKLISGFILGPWFLWAIWWCSLAVVIVKYLFKDNILIYLVGLVFTFFVPDGYGLELYKFMYPFFILGYLFNVYHDYISKFKNIFFNEFFIITIFCIFGVSLYFFGYNTYIYTSGYTLLGKDMFQQFNNDCLRFVAGLFGSITMMYIIYGISKIIKGKFPKWLSYIGKQTLGIYLISNILIEKGLKHVCSRLYGVNYILLIIETVVILVISLFITWLIQRNKITNGMLLGGR